MTPWIAVAALAMTSAPAVQVEAPDPVPNVQEFTVDVYGRSVRVLCTAGVPEVVFLHDAGHAPDTWKNVLHHLPPDVAACAYDRRPLVSGTSGGTRDMGWFELLEELVGVHAALKPRSGYVLVAQGEAATYARLLAASRRAPVGGLVLLEPAHESLPRLIRAGLPEEDWRSWMLDRARPNADGIAPADLATRVRRARLPDIPVTVVTADRRPAEPDWDERFGRHVPAPGSGPNLAEDAPALVADEILRVLRIAEGR